MVANSPVQYAHCNSPSPSPLPAPLVLALEESMSCNAINPRSDEQARAARRRDGSGCHNERINRLLQPQPNEIKFLSLQCSFVRCASTAVTQ
mmetsp:Transcript_31290/g.51814  ORF Transcript_31290/g.51814 Transcript_31290/m.51814 type:complete len:92 (-) Transcript_31290:1141-1416(-)